jgi:hypothetical protein
MSISKRFLAGNTSVLGGDFSRIRSGRFQEIMKFRSIPAGRKSSISGTKRV